MSSSDNVKHPSKASKKHCQEEAPSVGSNAYSLWFCQLSLRWHQSTTWALQKRLQLRTVSLSIHSCALSSHIYENQGQTINNIPVPQVQLDVRMQSFRTHITEAIWCKLCFNKWHRSVWEDGVSKTAYAHVWLSFSALHELGSRKQTVAPPSDSSSHCASVTLILWQL